MNNLYSINTVASVLSISKKTLQYWGTNGTLIPSYTDNKNIFYSSEQLSIFPEFNRIFNSKWKEQEKIIPSKKYSYIDLFSGCGGLALGLEKAGFQIQLLNDFDKICCETLKLNKPNITILNEDIRNIHFQNLNLSEVDLLSGGFPCQSFSYAGKKMGLNDTRGNLMFELLRAIEEIQPKIFLIENVKGLVSFDNGKILKQMINQLESIGYNIIDNHIYKMMFYKVPQKRERLVLIGIQKHLINNRSDLKFIRPEPFNKIVTVYDAFKKGILYPCDVPVEQGFNYSKDKANIMKLIPEGGNWKDLPIELQKSYLKSSFYSHGGKTSIAKRLAWNEPSLTLTCSPAQKQTERCHPEFNRPLTIREYARIQTFPDNWVFCGNMTQIYKQIGNAVPVNFAYAIGKSIINLLNKI